MRPAIKDVEPAIRRTIEDWLRENGGPRRFKQGTSNDFDAVRHFLAARGYEARFSQRGEVTVEHATERRRRFTVAAFFRFVDTIRIGEGLPPYLPTRVSA